MKAIVAILLFITSSAVAKIQLYTIENPPTVVRTKDGFEGLSGDFGKVVSDAIKKSGKEKEFELVWVPWKRALLELERNKSAVFFPFTRTAERESKFNWILHLADFDCWLYTLDPKIQITSLKDLKKYRVGVLAGSARELELRKHMGEGASIEAMIEDMGNYRKLQAGRIDIWATQPVVIAEAQRAFSKPANKVEVRALKKLLFQSLWLVGNKGMSDKDKNIIHEVFGAGDNSKSLKNSPLSGELENSFSRAL